jgi:RHS repeat-associated protein
VGQLREYRAYNYAATPACTAAPSSAVNSNKSSIVTTPTVGAPTTQSFCYDAADRLASSTGVTTLTHDTRGNVTTVNGDQYGYDGANRHAQTVNNNTTLVDPTPVHRATTAASNSAGSTSLTLTTPVTAVAGDILIASIAAADSSGGILASTGFETDTWTGSTSATTSQARSGTSSLSVDGGGSSSNVPFTTGVVNTLSGWMKGTGTVTPTIQFRGPTSAVLGGVNPTPKLLSAAAWSQWTTTYTPPPGTTFVQVSFTGTASPWFLDDTSVTANSSTLSTNGFEVNAWTGSPTNIASSTPHSGLASIGVGTSTATSQVRSNVSFTAGVANTLSAWMKGTGTVVPTIQFFAPSGATVGFGNVQNSALLANWSQLSYQYTPPSGTSVVQVTWAHPSAGVWNLDDVAVATGTGTSTLTSITPPPNGLTGFWSPVTSSSTTGVFLQTYIKVVASGEPVSQVFSLSQVAKATGTISAYSGVDLNNPYDPPATGSNASGTNQVAPSVSTNGANRLAITVTAAPTATSMTPPPGSTERADQAGGVGAQTATVETSDFGQPTAGPTGTKTTATAATATSTTATLALRPPTTINATAKVSYIRDATNRIVERKVNDVTVARYTFSSGGDTPDAELDATNVVQRRTLGLMGGAVLSKSTGSEIWSISNLHGDTIATLGSTGLVTGGPFTYDPFGKTIGGAPDNQIGSFDNGWLGKNQRPLEQQSGLRAVIEMGARIYDPQLGRFLQVDPIEGGTANDYSYVEDPINQFDLDGNSCWGSWSCIKKTAAKVAKNPIFQAVVTIAACSIGGPIGCAVANGSFGLLNSYERCKNGIGLKCVAGTALDLGLAFVQVNSVRSAWKAAQYGKTAWKTGAILVPQIGPRQAAVAVAKSNFKISSIVSLVQNAGQWGIRRFF